MFSDAALAIAVDTSTKWLYNASRRLRRPLRRSLEDAKWWRLTHHLAGRLGVPLADAARASDLLLAQGADLARVRLRSTVDDTVAISVELSRFHDGAAVAAAAALHLATPRRRGRPPRERDAARPSLVERDSLHAQEDSLLLARALSTVRVVTGGEGATSTLQLLSSITEAGVPFVIAGGVAGVFHGDGHRADSVDLVADPNARHARFLANALNRLGAKPRGVHIREGFHLDSSLVRAAPCLALRVDGISLNVTRSVPGVGEFPQVDEASRLVSLEGLSYRVLSREALARSAAALARLSSPA